MSRPSSIDRLPAEIRNEIGKLRAQGRTLDEIMAAIGAALADLNTQVSRSALGRHVRGYDKIAETMLRSRHVAEALVSDLGDEPESKTAQLNIELIHGAVMDLFMKADDEVGVDAGGTSAKQGNPDGLMKLAKALDHLGRARKSTVDVVLAAEKRAAEKAKQESFAAVESVAKESGLSAATVDVIKAKIFGVKS